MALIVDTGPLLAALDADDPDHARCAEALEGAAGDLVVPGLVLAELDYWCTRRLGVAVWLAFLDDLIGGAYRLEAPSLVDLARCRDLQHTHADLGLGVVDASVIALAERLHEGRVATLDRRHFSVVRPAHVASFEIVP